MRPFRTAGLFSIALALVATAPGTRAAGEGIDELRAQFAEPPKSAGTVTLWWLNGTLTKAEIREHMLALRDRDGFGGVAPLTLFRMKPATSPGYLTDEYFAMYGCILDTAKELGMQVVFYDDCDFPSGTAGNRMAELHPEHLMKYLTRGTATVTGPCDVAVSVATGAVMGVVARNLDTGARGVVTKDVRWAPATASLAGGSAGFRQPPEEAAVYEFLRIRDPAGRVLFEERFGGAKAAVFAWTNGGASTVTAEGLRATDCQPMWIDGLKLPAAYVIESRFRIEKGSAGLAFGVRGADDFLFWQFNGNQRALRPHVRRGSYRLLPATPVDIALSRWHDAAIDVAGDMIVTRLDGRAVATNRLEGGGATLRWAAPAGRWDLQAFVCATAPKGRFVDCLDPEAMAKFVGLTYDRFDDRFPGHFGSTIKMTFYDDLAVYHVPDCLMWTPRLMDAFRERHGRDAAPLLGALWEDIGPETGSARAALLGLRDEAFAAGYPGITGAWAARRGVMSSGHPAASYRANPLQGPGDSMLFYRDQGCPLTDYIHYWHHGVDGFKVPASAAANFDKPLLVCEIYGNFHQSLPNDSNMLYRAGMEVYARGVNCLLPHGTWWDPAKMRIVPEISWRNPAIGPELPAFNRWAARCESLLRAGRHVADIGILYPIDDLRARYHVGQLPFTHGHDPVPGSDYYDLMRILTGELRRDFTMLHPTVIDARCGADGKEFVLANKVNHERYRVVILPACRTIRLSNLEKIKAWLDGGGRVIATTCLPEKSAEFGRDADVKRLSDAMFGPGGKGVFVPSPDEASLRAALDGLGFAWDVRITGAPDLPRVPLRGRPASHPDAYEGGNRQFAYLHRDIGGAQVYFFANSSGQPVSADLTLRGDLALAVWDPHTGAIRPLDSMPGRNSGEAVTRARVSLEPIRSLFIVGRPRTSPAQASDAPG